MDRLEIERELDEIWSKVREKHLFPALPKPKIALEINGEPIGKAAIESINKQIVINPAFLEQMSKKMERRDLIEALLDHEVTHYTFCPWDFGTHLILYSKAKEAIKKEEKAEMATNYFMDVVANTHCVKERRTKIPELYKNLRKVGLDEIICSLYQKIWRLDLGVPEGRGRSKLIKKLLRIPYLDREKWEISIKKFSRYINRLLGNSSDLLGHHCYERYSPAEVDKGLRKFAVKIRDPRKFRETVKDLRVKLKLRGRVRPPDACMIFYGELAEQYSIPVKQRGFKKGGSLYPHSLTSWEAEKPIQDMDYWNSLGKMIPGITKIWKKDEGKKIGEKEEIPDCLIIIDSSGSMTNPEYRLSYAVLGSFCVANSYLTNEARVSVYNFSSALEGDEKILDFTRDRIKVYKAITKYFGRGTTLNPKRIESISKRAKTPDIFMITDMDIYNLDDIIDYLKGIDNRTTVVYLGTNKYVREFERGVKERPNICIYNVEKKEDIPKIVLGRVRKDIAS